MSDVFVLEGDVIAELMKLPAKSMQMVVTSPPYFRMRNYGIPPSVWCLKKWQRKCDHKFPAPIMKTIRGKVGKRSTLDSDQDRGGTRLQVIDEGAFCEKCGAWQGCHGLEPTLRLYIKHAVMIWREVWRVLRDDGVVFINLGDSYVTTAPGTPVAADSHQGKQTVSRDGSDVSRLFTRPQSQEGLKPKDMYGVPWRVAFALQDDGWYLRSAVVWFKPNPMPGSQEDRPTSTYEFVFLLTKQEMYFYDKEAVKVVASTSTHARTARAAMGQKSNPTEERNGIRPRRKPTGWHSSPNYHGANPDRPPGVTPKSAAIQHGNGKANPSFSAAVTDVLPTRNLRDVWEVEEDEWEQFMRWGWDAFQEAKALAAGEQTDVWKITTQSYKGAHFATYPEELVKPCILAGTSEKGACAKCGAPWTRFLDKQTVNLSNSGQSGRAINGKGHVSDQVREGHDIRNGPTSISQTLTWMPTCACDGIDRRLIATPLGSNSEDPTLFTGRAGLNREATMEEGRRYITRHEQKGYARQLRALTQATREQLAEIAGKDAFDHYMRTDDSGARPVPPAMLEDWLAKGWLNRVEIPPVDLVMTVPCKVLDIFAGSGTTGRVARGLGRDCYLIEIGAHHIPQIRQRCDYTPAIPGLFTV